MYKKQLINELIYSTMVALNNAFPQLIYGHQVINTYLTV